MSSEPKITIGWAVRTAMIAAAIVTGFYTAQAATKTYTDMKVEKAQEGLEIKIDKIYDLSLQINERVTRVEERVNIQSGKQ